MLGPSERLAAAMAPTLKRKVYEILEGGNPNDPLKRLVEWPLILLILLNVAVVIAETVEPVDRRLHGEFLVFEYVSVAIFTVEYALRLWVATEHGLHGHRDPVRARLRFAATPFALIDLAAILPFYLAFFVPGLDLRMLRIFRLLRLLKLARYSPALATLGKVIYEERRALGGALLIMIGLLMLAATAMYYAERRIQPENFDSIPAAMWWALATLTTVGYGDIVPAGIAGKIIGGLVMIFGLAMFALPVGIVASSFASEIHRRDFLVTWGMVAQVSLFQHLDAVMISRVSNLLRARLVAAETVIYRKGDEADSMCFIASGEVEVEIEPQPVRMRDGEFFGEIGLVRGGVRTATVRSVAPCRLLFLDVDDFNDLLDADTTLREAVTAAANARLGGG